MAKIKFGAIVTDMRGKVGSQVFSKNRAGAYTRSFKVNVVSATPAQVIVRNRLATYSVGWRSLSEVQRESWNNAVASFKSTNVFGSVINPSGFDLFVKLNCNLNQIGSAEITTAPIPGLSGYLKSLSVTASGIVPNVIITLDASTVPIGYKIVLSATACISAGKNYVKNLLREIDIIPQSQAMPYNATAAYVAKFTSILGGERISISAIIVNNVNGQKSEPLYATCIVAGNAGLDFDQALDTGIPLG